MDILAILLGAVMVLWGADKLTEGALLTTIFCGYITWLVINV